MATSITCNQGIVQINGAINVDNFGNVVQELEDILSRTERLTISLDHIYTIDLAGVRALTTLYRTAIRQNKALTIIGKGNKNVSKAFGRNYYILRNDVC